MDRAKEKGYVNYMPCYTSVRHFMERKSLTPILKELIELSALPLKSVETNFAVDSSGFRTTKFMEYCKIKHHTKSEHEWIKAHICCGVKTNNYHLRSNVESTFAMLKAKFSDLLRSKNRTAQVNELLLKILCHNIVVINNEFKASALS